MTTLTRRALLTTPLSEATVESFYDGSRSGTAEQCLKALCESHERFRAENQGLEVLLGDANAEIDRLKAELQEARMDAGGERATRLHEVGPIRVAAEKSREACRLIVAHYERSDPSKGRGPTLTDCVAKAKEALTALGEDF